MQVCEKCGLPKELCVCTSIKREEQTIKIYAEKRRFGKVMTIVEGVGENEIKELTKKFKSKLACGGTSKDGRIELQGEHRKKVKDMLIKIGFDEKQIESL